ncbi:hypothetical protein, partial [Nonomuraea sp. KC401]|uniref:hypothetical protein n=1 Tax=Nonomuraea sp. KC401 TaxID=1848324 RepID=UPI001BB25BF8
MTTANLTNRSLSTPEVSVIGWPAARAGPPSMPANRIPRHSAGEGLAKRRSVVRRGSAIGPR